MYRFLCSLGFGLMFLLPLQAQQELATHFMRDIWQSGLTNPALVTDKKIEIGLPGIYVNAASTGLKFGELVRTDEDGVNRVNIGEVVNALDEENYFRANIELETIHLAFQVKGWQLNFHHGLRFFSSFDYSKDLAEFVFLGNGGAIGETLELGPDIELMGYNEFAIGAAKKFGKLGVGARLKYLTGIGNVSTEKSRLGLTTDEDIYQ